MRRTIVFLALLGTMVAQIVAQQPQALYFHYKNGESFACEPSDISFITYDKSGASDEYDIQVIYFNDGTYQEIDFANVDSVGFNAPVPKLNDGAMVLDSNFEDYIVRGDTVSFTMRLDTPADLRPKVGNVVGSTWDNTVFEDGIIARVTGISETAEGFVYTCEKASLEDLYDEILYYGYGDIYTPVEEPAPAPRRKKKDFVYREDVNLWTIERNDKLPTLAYGDFSVDVGVGLNSHGKAKIYLNKPKGGRLYMRANVSSDFAATLDVALAGSTSYDTVYPMVKDFTLGVIATPIPCIFFKPMFNLGFYHEIAAQVNATFSGHLNYENEFQIEQKNGDWDVKVLKNRLDTGCDDASLSFSGSYGCGFEPVIFISLSGTKTGLAVKSRAGLQITADFRMNFRDYLTDGSVYQGLRNSSITLSAPLKAWFTVQLGFIGPWVKSADISLFDQNIPILQSFFLPDFSYMGADEVSPGHYSVSANMTPRWVFMPVKIGFAAFDEDNNLVEKVYLDTYHKDHKPLVMSHSFNFEPGREYVIAPIVNIFGFDLRGDRAEPIASCEPVDLGLSVKWSSTNLGADAIYKRGYAYQWGMTIPTHLYDHNHDYPYAIGELPQNISGSSSYDACTQLGKGWRLPTGAEWKELFERCTIEAVPVIPRPSDSVYFTNGIKVTGPNGNHIYIPGEVGYWGGDQGQGNVSYGPYEVAIDIIGTDPEYLDYKITQSYGAYEWNSCLIRPVCGD